jgi:hypothetical protein
MVAIVRWVDDATSGRESAGVRLSAETARTLASIG